ncbi:MAG: 1,4-dihydroxy-2-naphthoate polyprenyltransferase [Deltaproteobacteria bacterium]|nr:1,4-dihydroxy-2-naphthoate polyprenyltransferase [Deltaproteobacteria bacterium]
MKDWILAARLRTLPAAIAPVLIGCAIAHMGGNFHSLSAFFAMFGAILIQIGTNFANDYFDFINGADTEDRVGPTRATQAGLITPSAMKWAFIITFALVVPIIGYLAYRGGWPLIGVGIASIISGILYTGGPKPLGYMGLGDIFVLIFFGPVAVAGTEYVQSLQLSYEAILAGFASGLISTAILVVNNLRDKDTDKHVGKNTLAVRFGATFVRIEYSLCFIITGIITAYLSTIHSPWVLLAIFPLLRGIPINHSMWTQSGADLDPNLGKTAQVLILYSLFFSIGWQL